MYILNFNLLVTESKIKILNVTIPPIFRKKYRRRRETLRNNANIVKYNKHSIRTIQTPMARHRRRLAHGWSCTTLHIYIYYTQIRLSQAGVHYLTLDRAYLRCIQCKAYALARTNEQSFTAFVGEICHTGPLPPSMWKGRGMAWQLNAHVAKPEVA